MEKFVSEEALLKKEAMNFSLFNEEDENLCLRKKYKKYY